MNRKAGAGRPYPLNVCSIVNSIQIAKDDFFIKVFISNNTTDTFNL